MRHSIIDHFQITNESLRPQVNSHRRYWLMTMVTQYDFHISLLIFWTSTGWAIYELKLGTVVCYTWESEQTEIKPSGSQLFFVSPLSVSPDSSGRRPKRGKGSSELRLQTTINRGRFPKVSLVTPNIRVRPAPTRPPVTLPALEMDIKVAMLFYSAIN